MKNREGVETIRLATEVVLPFCNALSFIVNNRFIVEDKAFLMENDTDDPTMTPVEMTKGGSFEFYFLSCGKPKILAHSATDRLVFQHECP